MRGCWLTLARRALLKLQDHHDGNGWVKNGGREFPTSVLPEGDTVPCSPEMIAVRRAERCERAQN